MTDRKTRVLVVGIGQSRSLLVKAAITAGEMVVIDSEHRKSRELSVPIKVSGALPTRAYWNDSSRRRAQWKDETNKRGRSR